MYLNSNIQVTTLLFVVILLFPGGNVFSQDMSMKNVDKNKKVLIDDYNTVDEHIDQKGTLNYVFIWSDLDTSKVNSVSAITGLQDGFMNRIFIYKRNQKPPLNLLINQQGKGNKATILQSNSKSDTLQRDSTYSGENKAEIKQKGSNNSVTIIQN